MLEDKLLIWKFKRGSSYALQRIYEKYKDELYSLAIALSRDRNIAEDILQDVFVSFAGYASKLQIRTSLKSYLSSCIANRVRNLRRAEFGRESLQGRQVERISDESDDPVGNLIVIEQAERIERALELLTYKQKEVIILHLQCGMKFRAIAESQGESINTIQSRYRYGLERLKSQLNGKV